MVGLTIRTYVINSMLDVIDIDRASMGYLPGTREQKSLDFFRSTRAHAVLDRIGIPFTIGASPAYDEAIFAMDEHQQSLWRCATGDRYCLSNSALGVDSSVFDDPRSVFSEMAHLMPEWKIDLYDGAVQFQRGNAVISLHAQLSIRAVVWPNQPNYGFIHPGAVGSSLEAFLTRVL